MTFGIFCVNGSLYMFVTPPTMTLGSHQICQFQSPRSRDLTTGCKTKGLVT